jgi:hypothetical protein
MTPAAEHEEIFFAVRPQLASPYYVMDLELIAPATVLASNRPAARLVILSHDDHFGSDVLTRVMCRVASLLSTKGCSDGKLVVRGLRRGLLLGLSRSLFGLRL